MCKRGQHYHLFSFTTSHHLFALLIFVALHDTLFANPGHHPPANGPRHEANVHNDRTREGPSQPVQCFGRCVAKCLAEDDPPKGGKKSPLAQCLSKCRDYGQHSLCDPFDFGHNRKNRSNERKLKSSEEHKRANSTFSQTMSKSEECWKRCKDLDPADQPAPGPRPPLPPLKELKASYNGNHTIDVSWEPASGPEGDKVQVYMIQLEAEYPNHQLSQIFTQERSLRGLALPSLDNLCGSISLSVAAVHPSNGVGHFAKPVALEGPEPKMPAKLEIHSIRFNSTPFVTDEYDVNGTLDVEMKYKLDDWPFGIEDLEVAPIFHLLGCAEPDLSQATPSPEFHAGSKPNTVTTNLGADMMYRRCRFVYAVDEVRSGKCQKQFRISARPNDYASIEFNCESVEDANLAPGNLCAHKLNSKAPLCGQFSHFNFTVIENGTTNAKPNKEDPVSVNITFKAFQRILDSKPKFYVAIYGNAVKHSAEDERFIGGVNLTSIIRNMTNCAQFAADGSCQRPYSNNSIILDGLKKDIQYGVVLCAVLDPRNLSFPPLNSTDKYLKPMAFGLYLPSSSRGGHDSHEEEDSDDEEKAERKKEEKAKAKRMVVLLVAGAAVLVGLLLASVLAIFFWIRKQKQQLNKKRQNFEAMKRERETRYRDFPARRDEPWELERRNLIVYDSKRLGAGAFGSVYLGKLVGISQGISGNSNLATALLRTENSLVAVKMLPEYADELSKSEFLREISLMKTLGYHERLVNILACITQSEPYCLVVEYCSDGDLLQFLRIRCKYMLELDDAGVDYSDPNCAAEFDRSLIMTVKQLLMFAVQISVGLEYLSQKGFVHRDVAARNILVHDKRHAKIGDFGLCRFIYAESANYMGRGGRLPVKWMSPEAIRHYVFTTSSDVWSFGVLMFEIITLGGTPYPGIQPDNMLDFLESGNRISQPDNCPDEYYKVMRECWAADLRMRPEFAAIRQQLALQLENVSDEYSYLKLDAKKDYYNVSYGELKAQRGEDVGQQQQEEQEETNGKEAGEEQEEQEMAKGEGGEEKEVEIEGEARKEANERSGEDNRAECATLDGTEIGRRPR